MNVAGAARAEANMGNKGKSAVGVGVEICMGSCMGAADAIGEDGCTGGAGTVAMRAAVEA